MLEFWRHDSLRTLEECEKPFLSNSTSCVLTISMFYICVLVPKPLLRLLIETSLSARGTLLSSQSKIKD